MSEQASVSNLRLSAVKSNSRLLKGYGPLAVLLVAFVLMAMLVPTKAPQQEVVHESRAASTTGTGGAGAGGAAAGAGAGTAGGAAGAAGGGAGGAASGAATAAAKTAAAAGAATGKTGSCPGQTEQVSGDPYSPPCIAFSGNNGGPTSAGVTPTAINVSYRITSDSESFQQTLASLGGADITDTTADIERTVQALATYFDNHFQFYGRKLNIQFFNGQGSITNELLGSGQQQADADAVTAAQQLHAFAELNGVSEPYDVALAQQKVISFGAPYLSASFMGQYAPYMWSLDTESNDVVEATSELYLKSLAGGKAQWAGGACRTSPARWRSSPRATRGTRRRRSQPCRRPRRPATRLRTTSRTS